MTVTSSRRRLGALVLCISVLALVGAACGGSSGGSKTNSNSSSTVPSGDVAKVGSVDVTQAQFNDLMATAKQSYKTSKKKFPAVGTAAYATVRDQAVSQLVQEAEISIGAKNLNITVTQPEVEKALTTIKNQYFQDTKTKKYDPAKYKAALKAQGTTDARVRNQLHAEADGRQDHREADEGRHRHRPPRSRATTRRTSRSSRCPRRATSVTSSSRRRRSPRRSTACSRRRTRTSPTLAKKYSTDKSSAVNGGDLKMIQQGQTVPTFDAVVFSPKTKTNVVQPPVKSTYGYHVIEALGPIKPATYRKLDATLKASIKTQLIGTAKQKKISTWLTALKSSLAKEISYAKGYTPTPTATTSTTTTTAASSSTCPPRAQCGSSRSDPVIPACFPWRRLEALREAGPVQLDPSAAAFAPSLTALRRRARRATPQTIAAPDRRALALVRAHGAESAPAARAGSSGSRPRRSRSSCSS